MQARPYASKYLDKNCESYFYVAAMKLVRMCLSRQKEEVDNIHR